MLYTIWICCFNSVQWFGFRRIGTDRQRECLGKWDNPRGLIKACFLFCSKGTSTKPKDKSVLMWNCMQNAFQSKANAEKKASRSMYMQRMIIIVPLPRKQLHMHINSSTIPTLMKTALWSTVLRLPWFLTAYSCKRETHFTCTFMVAHKKDSITFKTKQTIWC